ncbi:iron complex transport system permease protein [Terrimicrobium sacchariphilum]|uniref:Iron complex transport system permease protein n=1 Tax=Terrimicrobium sacchariphilum TaxID=690879 RepID=A0A146GAX2_TERSA|nr:iron ABC transporter permease [Terrimicrobium sacchariphilum]GAT33974.1 iron complex transport system permease protein [Terrimicrobium sacchariphilum]
MRARTAWVLPGFAALLAIVVILALGAGRFGIGWLELGQLVTGHAADTDAPRWGNIFFQLRLPRILAAALVGSSLAVAGASYQAMFANPLVSPNLCGVLAGSSFGAALGMVISTSWIVVQISTFVCGLAAVGVALGIAAFFRRSSDPMLILVLGGVVATALFSALLAIVKYLADPYDKLPSIVYWLMGSFALSEWSLLARTVLPMLMALGVLMAIAGRLNVLSLGDEPARALGLSAGTLRLVAILMATILSSLTVVIGGEIGWIGLIIPHAARLLTGPDNRLLLPASALLGAAFLVGVDTAARTLFRSEIPVGIITALLGVVTFIAVLGRVRKGWAS